MAIKVKDAAASAKKFVARGQAAGQDYADGVRSAGPSWQAATAASGDTWAQGVQAAVSRGAFVKGVNDSGGDRYQAKASGIGAQRFGPGIAQAGPDWQKGTQPYLDTLANLTLPPRRPKGDPGNWARAQAVGDALRKKKTGQ